MNQITIFVWKIFKFSYNRTHILIHTSGKYLFIIMTLRYIEVIPFIWTHYNKCVHFGYFPFLRFFFFSIFIDIIGIMLKYWPKHYSTLLIYAYTTYLRTYVHTYIYIYTAFIHFLNSHSDTLYSIHQECGIMFEKKIPENRMLSVFTLGIIL